MEFYDQTFLEELLAQRRDFTCDTNPLHFEENNQLFSNPFDCFDQNSSSLFLPNPSSYQEVPQSYNNYTFNEIYNSLLDEFSTPQIIDSSYNTTTLDNPQFLAQEDYPFSMMEDEDLGLVGEELQNLEDLQVTCKMEPSQSPENPVFNSTSTCLGRKNQAKKLQGQPSKNLMAERRRRKRVNDRLSMLRSIVPKISKMDRTSILGDTIDYMKELLEKINNLKKEIEVDSNMASSIFKEVKPNELLVRNSPKFDVERRNVNTKVEISCAGKPGLLVSTVNTLEALGLEIQHCVISCFNDFSLQASCSEELEQKAILSSEDIKQALFRNAGYGGRCL